MGSHTKRHAFVTITFRASDKSLECRHKTQRRVAHNSSLTRKGVDANHLVVLSTTKIQILFHNKFKMLYTCC